MHFGGLPPMMWQFADSSGGMLTIQCCQLPRTSGAEPGGNSSCNAVSCGAGTVSNVNDVTMPKLPPPPPRNAQNRSGCADKDAVRDRPSAVTTCAEISRSQVSPYLRDSTPSPPPRVRPAMPTDGQVPAGKHLPAS